MQTDFKTIILCLLALLLALLQLLCDPEKPRKIEPPPGVQPSSASADLSVLTIGLLVPLKPIITAHR